MIFVKLKKILQKFAVDYLLSQSLNREKMVLGLPNYGLMNWTNHDGPHLTETLPYHKVLHQSIL